MEQHNTAGILLLLLLTASYASAGYTVTGDYVQDTYTGENYSDLFNASLGWHFDKSMQYEGGEYSAYSWQEGNIISKTASDLPLEGTYQNIQRLLFHGSPSYGNPAHRMTERIIINSSRFWYYEPGTYSKCSSSMKLEVPKNSVIYQVDTGYIPAGYITDSTSPGCDSYNKCYADFEYSGQIPFLGREYYVKNIDNMGLTLYLCTGSMLNITNAGYSAEYMGYSFRLNNTYAPENASAYLVIDVRKPDGTIEEVSASSIANGVVDGIEIAAVNAATYNSTQTASIIVYKSSSEAVLRDGENLEINGKTIDNWEVRLSTADRCGIGYVSDGTENDCNITAYRNMDEAHGSLIKRITLKNTKDISGYDSLGVNESLEFPETYQLTFKGFLNAEYREVPATSSEDVYATYYIGTKEKCDLKGDYTPCDTVSINEVVDAISEWTENEATILDVIKLIDAWAKS